MINLLEELNRNLLIMSYKSNLTLEENQKKVEKKLFLNENSEECSKAFAETDDRIINIYSRMVFAARGHFRGSGTIEKTMEKAINMIKGPEDITALNKLIKACTKFSNFQNFIWSEFRTDVDEDKEYLKRFDDILRQKGVSLDLCYNCDKKGAKPIRPGDPDTLEGNIEDLNKRLNYYIPNRREARKNQPPPSELGLPYHPYVDIPWEGDAELYREVWRNRMERNKRDNYPGIRKANEYLPNRQPKFFDASRNRYDDPTDTETWYFEYPGYTEDQIDATNDFKSIYVDPPSDWLELMNNDSELEIEKTKKQVLGTYNTYPNYCSYSAFTLPIPKRPDDVTGPEAAVRGHCYYLGGGGTGLWLPSNSVDIEFMNTGEAVDQVDNLIKTFDLDIEDRQRWGMAFTKEFPTNSVLSFKFKSGGTRMAATYKVKFDDYEIKFTGAFVEDIPFNSNKKPISFTTPEWKDERSTWDIAVDRYGFYAQLASAAFFFVGSFFAGPAGWFLFSEIVIELGLGIATGVRDIEKGDNVGGALSILFGTIPMLKMTKWYSGGVDQETLKSLASKFAKSGLTKTSSDVYFWQLYWSLSGPEQIAFTKFLGDNATMWQFVKSAKALQAGYDAADVVRAYSKLLGKNTAEMVTLKLYDKAWFKELVIMNGPFISTLLIYKSFFDNPLPQSLQMDLQGIYLEMSDEYKNFMTEALVDNLPIFQEVAGAAVNADTKFKKISSGIDEDIRRPVYENVIATSVKQVLQENSGKLPDSTNVSDTYIDEFANLKGNQELIQDGYTQINPGEFPKVNNMGGDSLTLSRSKEGKFFYKILKKQ